MVIKKGKVNKPRPRINDVPKAKTGKKQNKNWALICRGSKTSRRRYLIFGNRWQTKEVPGN